MANAKRKLKVTSQKPITNIKLKNGGTTTLYEVFAVTEDGGFVEEALRAFQELDKGQVIEYTIEPYNHPRHGMSYTLFPPKPETARRLRELEETVAALVRWAENQGCDLSHWKKVEGVVLSAAEGVAAEVEKEKQEAELDERFGTDPPWGPDSDAPPKAEKGIEL